MAKKRDPKAKQKRQIMIAAGGAVLLVGILAIQVPRTMKQLNPPPAAPAASEAPVSTSATPSGSTAPPANTALVEAPLVPSAEAAALTGQLVSFELFETKDPFVQQVKTGDAVGDDGGTAPPPDVAVPLPPDAPALPPDVAPPLIDNGSGGSGSGSSSGSGSGTGSGPGSGSGSSSGSGSGSGSSSGSGGGSTGTLTVGTISVNGVQEVVTVGKDFPQDDPLFTLVSLTATSAEIAIAGGSYQDGNATVTLAMGKTLTLMNTADGARYEIRLVAVGNQDSSTTP